MSITGDSSSSSSSRPIVVVVVLLQWKCTKSETTTILSHIQRFKKLSHVRETTPIPTFVQIYPQEVYGKMSEIQRFSTFLFMYFFQPQT